MSEHPESYNRFQIAQRIEHIVLILSFTILALTGLPQKYPLSPISQGIVGALGGIEAIRIIHRVAATIFVLESVYHLVYVGYMLFVKRRQASMVPTLDDGKDAIQSISYNLGLTKQEPKMPRFNFAEKMEYWAMLWGLLVMAVTGFMLWNPIATARILPGEFIPAAKVAHGGEAILAVLAIIIWHFYNVHIRTFNKSMFTGKLS
ncbi:MAG TPA: cytochrome b/b6 domain-containing protein, partial [Anaerolineaceae bacterium]|nr:cytochrome b/b6 domain-containing protein [Anaerolineaceae bacterium]